MVRVIFYAFFISFLLFVLPLPGSIDNSNNLTEAMFLRDGKLGVTFPWGGVLIKEGLPINLRTEVLSHELCHVEQVNRIGVFFIIAYLSAPDKFEAECYKVSNITKLESKGEE